MYCRYCGAKIKEGDSICPECGQDNNTKKVSQKEDYLSSNKIEIPNRNDSRNYMSEDLEKNKNYSISSEEQENYGKDSGKKRVQSVLLIALMVILAITIIVLGIFMLSPNNRLSGEGERKVSGLITKNQTKDSDLRKADLTPDDPVDPVEPYVPDGIESPSDYIIPNGGSRYVAYTELDELSTEDLKYATNEFYARRGRRFNADRIRNYFNRKSWYKPEISADSFSDWVFNRYELYNIDLLAIYQTIHRYNNYSFSPGERSALYEDELSINDNGTLCFYEVYLIPERNSTPIKITLRGGKSDNVLEEYGISNIKLQVTGNGSPLSEMGYVDCTTPLIEDSAMDLGVDSDNYLGELLTDAGWGDYFYLDVSITSSKSYKSAVVGRVERYQTWFDVFIYQ